MPSPQRERSDLVLWKQEFYFLNNVNIRNRANHQDISVTVINIFQEKNIFTTLDLYDISTLIFRNWDSWDLSFNTHRQEKWLHSPFDIQKFCWNFLQEVLLTCYLCNCFLWYMKCVSKKERKNPMKDMWDMSKWVKWCIPYTIVPALRMGVSPYKLKLIKCSIICSVLF